MCKLFNIIECEQNLVLFSATRTNIYRIPLTITEMRIVKQYIIMIVKLLEITREELSSYFC